MNPITPADRALMMRLPLREVVPQAMRGVSGDLLRRLEQVTRLRKAGLLRVELDVDASDARHITRTLHLTAAGVAALHAKVSTSSGARG